MSQSKPFTITKRAVWEAYQKVKANRGAAGVDGDERVPVVGSGDRDSVDRLVFQQLPVVGVDGGLLLGDGLDVGRCVVQHLLVDVAERHQLDIGLAGDFFDVVFAAAAQADGGDPNGIVRAAKDGIGGDCRGRRGDKKVSSVHEFFVNAIRALLYHIPRISAQKRGNAGDRHISQARARLRESCLWSRETGANAGYFFSAGGSNVILASASNLRYSRNSRLFSATNLPLRVLT